MVRVKTSQDNMSMKKTDTKGNPRIVLWDNEVNTRTGDYPTLEDFRRLLRVHTTTSLSGCLKEQIEGNVRT